MAHPQIIAVHHSRHLADALSCRDRRQYMDRQITRRNVVDKDHGKQMAHFLHQAFRQGLKRSVDKGVVGVYGSQRPGVWAQESTGKDTGSRTIAFILNSVGVTAKSPSLRERVRTVCTFWYGVGCFYKKFRGPKLSSTRSTLLYSRNPKREILDGSASILENGWIRFFPLGSIFVDRPAISREEIVVKFLF